MTLIGKLGRTFVMAVVASLGAEVASSVWNAGLKEKVDEQAKKLFPKRKES